MRSPVPESSLCRRSRFRVPLTAVLTLLSFPCLFWILFNSSSLAAGEEASKAFQRTSPEGGTSFKYPRRVALVIGNSDYKAKPLRNPARDAEDLSGVLRSLGFAVLTKTNVNQRQMEEAANEFLQRIQNGDVALFYYSGHGVSVGGDNYLIPLGDSITSEADVRFKAFNAGLVLAKMEESLNRINIVILDACRNNPFKGLFRSATMGLSKLDAPKGTIIAYATSPGSVAADGKGDNSPYTRHLIEALKVKDISIEQAFKLVARAVNEETGGRQTPWISSSLLDDFYCNPSSPAGMQAASLPAPTLPRPVAAPFWKYREKVEQCNRQWDSGSGLTALRQLCGAAEAVKWIREAAEQGEAVAQWALGEMFCHGIKRGRDWEVGATWLRKAAEQSNALAARHLALLYESGRGVLRELEEARKWLAKAAEQGDAGAQEELGLAYANARFWPGPNYQVAAVWFRKAAEQGLASAQGKLGWMYENGFGVPKDRAEAFMWYEKAADQGDSYAKA